MAVSLAAISTQHSISKSKSAVQNVDTARDDHKSRTDHSLDENIFSENTWIRIKFDWTKVSCSLRDYWGVDPAYSHNFCNK